MRRAGRGWNYVVVAIIGITALGCPPRAGAQFAIGLDELTLELDLGGSGDAAFHRIGGVALSGAEELFVVDQFNHSVRSFDLQGRLLREFGGQGAGPGEFEFPTGLVVRDSTLRVTDVPLARLSTFSLDGTLLGTEPYRLTGPAERSPSRHGLSLVAPLRMGWTLAWSSPQGGFVDQPIALIDFDSYVVAVDDGGQQDTLLVMPQSWEVFYRRDSPNLVSGGLGGGFGLSGVWAGSGESLVAVLDTYTGRGRVLRLTDTGPREAGAFDLDWRPLPVDETREVEAARRRATNVRGGSPGDYEVTVPEYYAQSGRILFADGGRLWIHHDPDMGGVIGPDRDLWYKNDEPQQWYVVSWLSGRVLATVETPANIFVQGVEGARLFGIHHDELDVQTVRVYRIPAIPEG
jgi:hypothetical protein